MLGGGKTGIAGHPLTSDRSDVWVVDDDKQGSESE
jgi:hypothetical protein